MVSDSNTKYSALPAEEDFETDFELGEERLNEQKARDLQIGSKTSKSRKRRSGGFKSFFSSKFRDSESSKEFKTVDLPPLKSISSRAIDKNFLEKDEQEQRLRLEGLKDRIAKGQYNPDNSKVARSIVDFFSSSSESGKTGNS